ncbi:MAG: Uma2 family endonuclease [Acidobacteria bacterium]|nr:Uma2 family endonuclease [Acidobacteriota bacterium]
MSALQKPAHDLLYTSSDLLAMPDDGKLYEIIEGELYASTQPNWHHQYACSRLLWALEDWDNRTALGIATGSPGLIFGDHDDVAPDVVWISLERLSQILGEDGKLHAAPELVVEVISPGWKNELRDRDTKLKLYSRRGVREYWIVDWQRQQVEIYRRSRSKLAQIATLLRDDELTSPLLPGFSCKVSTLFMQIPPAPKA